MKIRNGFVSNSSSSSYIIAFDGDESSLSHLFVDGNYSGDSTQLESVGIENVIDDIKGWYSIGEADRYWYGEAKEETDEMREYRWNEFVRFAGIASRIARAVEDGDNVALVRISYGDDQSYENLHSDGIRVIESFE